MARVALVILVIALWIYGIIDCARTPRASMPGRLPKWVWMLLVVVPVIGAVLWLVLSWPIKHPEGFGTLSLGGGGSSRPAAPAQGPVAPDDDPEFLAKLDARNRFAEWERQQAAKDSEDAGSDLDAELEAFLTEEGGIGPDDQFSDGDSSDDEDPPSAAGHGNAPGSTVG